MPYKEKLIVMQFGNKNGLARQCSKLSSIMRSSRSYLSWGKYQAYRLINENQKAEFK